MIFLSGFAAANSLTFSAIAENRDDVLTTLIHLGYLSYDSTRRTARIPNLETRNNFLTQIDSEKTKEHSCKIERKPAAI